MMSAYLRQPTVPRGASRTAWRACARCAVALRWRRRRGRARRRTASNRSPCRRASSGRTVVRFAAEERRPPIRRRASRSRARRASRSTSSTRPTALGATQRTIDDGGAAQPQRDPGRQPHARRVQPQPAADVRHQRRGQRGAGHAVRPGRPQAGARRRSSSTSPRPRPGDVRSMRCATSTSAAAATARAGSSSICPTARPASTSASRASTLIVDFLKTTVPRNLERRLDVADFGTPVVTVDTFQQGSNARMVIEPKGLWEHSAYQTDNRFILEIKPILEDPNKLMQGSRGGLQGREAVAQLPERRSALGAAGDRRLHRPQHHHQRHGAGQPHAAAEGHPLGPGARHHPADQGPRHAQERQCRADRAARGAGAQGKAAARERDRRSASSSRSRPRSFQLNYIKAADLQRPDHASTASSSSARGPGRPRRPAARARSCRKRGVAIVDPRTQHPVRAGHGVAARGGPPDHPADRHRRSARC